ncbi:hypothetical protein E1B28_011974 [Marasmius oreades]|uniref:SH3 domain-containing protein n=1 Tax=Marasmius oreades TaxID=181124 RepID=A0A9P7RRV1_9AGAR|nr:uncharacterized protein E1B28_011974 [Marasmius oreades]KAG7087928.1 hypothetical protein E1B28_011974 [Marasmius oreades]
MRVRRGHAAMSMKTVNRRSVEEREPGLINLPVKLPVALPSIPLLDPVIKPAVTWLVDGPETATPTEADPPPTSPTAPPSNPGNGSGNGNDNGNGKGGGEEGGSGTGNGDGDGGKGSGSGNSSDSGSGAGTGNGSGNDSGNGTGTGSGSGGGGNTNTGNNGNTGNTGSSQSDRGQTGGSNAGGSKGGQGSQGQNNTPQRPPTIPGSNSSSKSVSGSDRSPASNPVFAAGAPASQTSSSQPDSGAGQNLSSIRPTPTAAVAGPTSQAGGSIGSSSVGNGGGGSIGSSDGGSSNTTQTHGTNGAHSGNSNKLASGAIAGIVVACGVVLLLLLVFFRRRRLIAIRNQRRDRWNGTAVVSSAYDFSDGHDSSGPASARSSFATAYDMSTELGHARPATPPVPVPQMAELRDAHVPGTFSQRLVGTPISPRSPPPPPILVSVVQTTDADGDFGLDHNTPMQSAQSLSSDPYSQGQVIKLPPDLLLSLEPLTPMSVRPFSPTESFSFPKPPDSSRRTRGTSILADGALSPSDPGSNPFSDPLPPSPSSPSELAETEVIRRPFLPTRDDELAVSAGDKVTIVQVFDDGWVAVRKAGAHVGKGKGKAAEGGPGLIPIDCFRGQDQELPEFLALKRVSSYGEN